MSLLPGPGFLLPGPPWPPGRTPQAAHTQGDKIWCDGRHCAHFDGVTIKKVQFLFIQQKKILFEIYTTFIIYRNTDPSCMFREE